MPWIPIVNLFTFLSLQLVILFLLRTYSCKDTSNDQLIKRTRFLLDAETGRNSSAKSLPDVWGTSLLQILFWIAALFELIQEHCDNNNTRIYNAHISHHKATQGDADENQSPDSKKDLYKHKPVQENCHERENSVASSSHKEEMAYAIGRQCALQRNEISAYPTEPVYGAECDHGMHREKNRFASFDQVPEADLPPNTRPIKLAREGFYFDKPSRQVRCFSCGHIYSGHFSNCRHIQESRRFNEPPSPPPSPASGNPQAMGMTTREFNQQAVEETDVIHNLNLPAGDGRLIQGSPAAPVSPTTQGPRQGHIPYVLQHTAPVVLGATNLSYESRFGATGGHTPSSETCDETVEDACRICQQNPVEITFLPCGHHVSCRSCAAGRNVCSICHERITETRLWKG